MIFDTMVMAYAMLGVPEFSEELVAVLDEIVAPASALERRLAMRAARRQS